MQLFSFGLVHRQQNGGIKLNESNLPAPTYDNDTIKALARVFTGLSFSYVTLNDEKTKNQYFNRYPSVKENQYRWIEPMIFFAEQHDFEQKTLFTDGSTAIEIPAREASVENADQELTEVIEYIVAHSSTAPMIAEQLIKRFVTSNPSPDYIERVAQAFGTKGDMRATIKAILLDPEARNPSVFYSTTHGKVKEPVIRFTALMRLLEAYSSITLYEQGINASQLAQFADNATLLRVGDINIGQYSLGADSVFNFFQPDYTPPGALANASLVAPELQLMTESQLVSTLNASYQLIDAGFARWSSFNKSSYSQQQVAVKLSYHYLNVLHSQTSGSDHDKAKAVVDHLDRYLNAGQLSQPDNSESYQAIIDAVVATSTVNEKLKLAVYGVFNAPESLVQQ